MPTIVYTGPSENLPTIFYNLNTGGVNLSKYETFSSLWDLQRYKLEDKEINEKNSSISFYLTSNSIGQ